jgi:ketosteroid isomerase-like protein
MPSAEAEVLAANQAFYDAFAHGDADAMDALWARRTPVACIHPGWDPLHGRAEVVASWRAILVSRGSPQIRCHSPSAFVLGEGAYVLCYEEIEGAELIATNLFCREDGAWKLVHHQAGPVHRRVERRPRPPTTGGGSGGMLN